MRAQRATWGTISPAIFFSRSLPSHYFNISLTKKRIQDTDLGGCVFQSHVDPFASIPAENQVFWAKLLLFSHCQEGFVSGVVLSSLQGQAGISWSEVEISSTPLQPSFPWQCWIPANPHCRITMSFFENRWCVGWPCLMGRGLVHPGKR